jgi:ferritin-like metal-binding protein YciE
MEKPYLTSNLKIDEDALKKTFICKLNELYLILLSLTQCLPLIAKATNFGDLENVIEQLLSEVKIQIFRIDQIFVLFNIIPNDNNFLSVSKILQLLPHKYEYGQMDNLSKDLSIVFHLQKILAIQHNYFHILKSIANSLNNISIKQYLQYSCDECKDSKEMLDNVAKDYIESHIDGFLK